MSTPSHIAQTFAALRSQNRMAFMPFITAGDPDLETTLAVVRELSQRDVDLIEVGFPYSDPIADGPVIQASYTRALERHVHVEQIFAAFRALRTEDGSQRSEDRSQRPESGKRKAESGSQETEFGDSSSGFPLSALGSPPSLPPLVAMVSYAIIFRVGLERFVERAAEAGFAGLIVPDLPGDEAAGLAAVARSRGLDLVQLVAPTTPPPRAEKILQAASGFVYCIAVAGTTGVRDELPPELREQLAWLRTRTDLPLAVGFGVSRPDQVETLRGAADGVIVGSAIVRQFEALSGGSESRDAVLSRIGDFAAQMVAATHR